MCTIKVRQRGFSLLEAIVALVLIATTGLAAFSWLNTNLITLGKVRDTNAQSAATLNVLELVQTINPMQTQEGQSDLGAYSVRWKSQLVTQPRDTIVWETHPGLWVVALYEITADVLGPDKSFWFQVKLRQLGYKKVRTPATDG